MINKTLIAAAALPLLAACSDASGPDDGRRVAVRFNAGAGADR